MYHDYSIIVCFVNDFFIVVASASVRTRERARESDDDSRKREKSSNPSDDDKYFLSFAFCVYFVSYFVDSKSVSARESDVQDNKRDWTSPGTTKCSFCLFWRDS